MGVPSRFGQIQADAFLGSAHDNSPFGKIWYVDVTNGSDGNSGEAPDEAYASIGQAISAAVATRGDTVVIAPGTYTITSALAPKAFMTFRAAVVNPQTPSVSIRGNIANITTVNVDGTRFVGVEFRATGSTAKDLVALASSAAVNGVTFEDCVFNGNDQTAATPNGTAGIQLTNGSNAVTGLTIRRCVFRDLGKTCVDVGILGLPHAKIEDNAFILDTASAIGIAIADTTAFNTGKGYIIRNNDFIGGNSTTSQHVGIVIAGTVNTVGAGMIRNNFFGYCADAAVTVDKVPASTINNYYGNNAGGVLVDSSAGA